MEQLRQASPVARAAGQPLATRTFALLKRNGKKGRTETPPQRSIAGPGSGGAQRAPPRPPAAGTAERGRAADAPQSGNEGVRGPRGRGAGGGAEAPRSPAQRRRALLPPGGGTPHPAPRCAALLCSAPTGRPPRPGAARPPSRSPLAPAPASAPLPRGGSPSRLC